jgi:signal transduction histidine kinase
MTIRALLALLIALALAASLTISAQVDRWYATVEPGSSLMVLRDFLEWISGPIPIASVASLFMGIIVSILFFIAVNAFVVRPLRLIDKALRAFAEKQVPVQLPRITNAPREILELAAGVQVFAAKVAEAHAKDSEISRVKSDFISTAAHQLRTPLTGIRWALEALEKEPLNESQQLLVKNAVDKSHDLVAVVGTLLDISSIESGKYKYDFKVADLNSVVEEVVGDFLPHAKQSGVTLTYEQNALPAVRMDRERMKWVLNNLVENAIRYTPPGGIVHVATQNMIGRAVVHVRDTGIGIKDEDRNNIFERFFRAGNAIAKENKGNGLGLYIARTIVTDHGGDLSFAANPEGVGTTFTLDLPVAA